MCANSHGHAGVDHELAGERLGVTGLLGSAWQERYKAGEHAACVRLRMSAY